MKKLRNIFTLTIAIALVSSCSSDFLEPTVATSKDLDTNINDVDDLNGIMLGAYERLSAVGFYGRDVIIHASTRSDDGWSDGNSGRFIFSADWNYQPTSGDVQGPWNAGYQAIANANIVINRVTSDAGTPEVDHVKGEAYAVRALAHMEILKFYGQQWAGGTLGIPYITEYLGNLEPSRNTVAEVWANIEADFDMARTLMSESLNDGPVRLTTYAVAGLQSRYYLYAQKWPEAIAAANYALTGFIPATDLPTGTAYLDQFVGSDASSSLFELAFNTQDNPGINGLYNIMNSNGYGDVVVTQNLIDQYEVGDARAAIFGFDVWGRGRWRVTGKYPSSTFDDNVRVIRYAEVLLNRAEAYVQDGQAPLALADINAIANAAGATPYATATLANVLQERRKELAFEGFRWFDLMRNGLPVVKQAEHSFSGSEVAVGENRVAFPIPENELNANSNMVQNAGY